MFGVADNHPVGMKDDGDRFYTLMNDVGMNEDRITVLWNQTQPTTISGKAELEGTLAQASEHGIKIVFAVYPLQATALASSPSAPDQFVTFLQLVATSFPDVTTFVVGNEFNQPKFYQPQFGSDCKSLSGGSYLRLLAFGSSSRSGMRSAAAVAPALRPGCSGASPGEDLEGELGRQVGVQTGGASPYYGRENVAVTTESNQAQIYSQLVQRMACDSLVDAMLFYGLVDEPDLDRFQAGLLRAGWTKRPAYEAVKQAIAKTKRGCQGQQVQWHHSESVLGSGVDFGKLRVQSLRQSWWGFSATAKEDATYSAGIFQLQGRQITDNGRQAIVKALLGKGGAKRCWPSTTSSTPTGRRSCASRPRRSAGGTTCTGSASGRSIHRGERGVTPPR